MKLIIAYIDPGTGSILLQTIIGGAMAVLYTTRRWIVAAFVTIKSVFKRSSAKESKETKN